MNRFDLCGTGSDFVALHYLLVLRVARLSLSLSAAAACLGGLVLADRVFCRPLRMRKNLLVCLPCPRTNLDFLLISLQEKILKGVLFWYVEPVFGRFLVIPPPPPGCVCFGIFLRLSMDWKNEEKYDSVLDPLGGKKTCTRKN
jgi:hypothetical protein